MRLEKQSVCGSDGVLGQLTEQNMECLCVYVFYAKG